MDPLSAIGGASAVIGLIQSGFQFAQALHEYAKDVKKVPDEIIGLPDRLFESVGLVDEVNNLLTLNRQTHAWTELGVRRAEGDIVVCYEIITPLQELLSKAGIGAQDKITKEDLNISVLQSLTWPILYGSKVEKTKDDLQNFYSRVSVTILTYQIRTSTSNVQKTVSEKKLSQLLAKEMSGKQHHDDGEWGLKDAVRQYKSGGGGVGSKPREASRSPGSESMSDDEDNLEAICQALKDITRAELAREDAAVKADEISRQVQAENAVTKWQAEAKDRWQEQEVKRSQLRGELLGRLENSTVDAVVNSVFPEMAHAGLPFAPTTKSPQAPRAAAGTTLPLQAHGTSHQKKRRFGLFRRKSTTSPALDAELQEMISPAGRQFLRGFVFAYDQEKRIQITTMNAPQHVLVDKLSITSGKQAKGEYTAWEEYGYLPSALRQAINSQCKRLDKLDRGDSFWTIVHLERILDYKKGGLFRSKVEQIKGAYVVFRHVNPNPVQTELPAVLYEDEKDARYPTHDTVFVRPNNERYKSEIGDVLRRRDSDLDLLSIDSGQAKKMESIFGPGAIGKMRNYMKEEALKEAAKSHLNRRSRSRSRSRQRSASASMSSSSSSSSDRRTRRTRRPSRRSDRRDSVEYPARPDTTPAYYPDSYETAADPSNQYPPPPGVRSRPRRRQSSGYSSTAERKPRSRHARIREDINIYHSPQPLGADYDRTSPEVRTYLDEPITSRLYAATEPTIRERPAPSRLSRRNRARTELRQRNTAAAEYDDAPVEDEVARLMSELTTGGDEGLVSQGQDPEGYGVPERMNAVDGTGVLGAGESNHEPSVGQAQPSRSDTFALSNAESGASAYQSPTAAAVSEDDTPLQVIQGEVDSRDLRPR